MARMVLISEVSEGRIRGWPRLGWMDPVRGALGNRVMTVEAARKIGKSGEPWFIRNRVSRGHFCLALCSFGRPSRDLVVIAWRGVGCRYMMRLGYSVKRAQLLKIKTQESSMWAKECILMIVCVCVLSDLTWLPLLDEGRKSLYIIIIKQRNWWFYMKSQTLIWIINNRQLRLRAYWRTGDGECFRMKWKDVLESKTNKEGGAIKGRDGEGCEWLNTIMVL